VLALPIEVAVLHLDQCRKARVRAVFDQFGAIIHAMPFGDQKCTEEWMDRTAASVGLPSPRRDGLLALDEMDLDEETRARVDEINREATERLRRY